jgi:hypothetical protein
MLILRFFATEPDAESMVNLFSFIKDYLVDQESGIHQLITWFLNLVMEKEPFLQSGAQRYERTDSVPLQKYFPHILRLFLFPSNLILTPVGSLKLPYCKGFQQFCKML